MPGAFYRAPGYFQFILVTKPVLINNNNVLCFADDSFSNVCFHNGKIPAGTQSGAASPRLVVVSRPNLTIRINYISEPLH